MKKCIAVVVLLFASCSVFLEDATYYEARRKLNRSEAQWEELSVQNYSFTYNKQRSHWGGYTFTVEVTNGVVAAWTLDDLRGGVAFEQFTNSYPSNISVVIDDILNYMTSQSDVFSSPILLFDTNYYFPTYVFYEPDGDDRDTYWEITEFTVLTN